MKFNKKKLYNLFFVIVLGLIFIPYTRGVLQIGITRLFSWSPEVITPTERPKLNSYQWSLQGINTASIHFESTKRKVVLINFWATWCPPCIAEMPSLQNLYQTYKDRVVFIMVTNDDPSKVNAFLEKHNYTFPVYQSLSDPNTLFNVSSIPATYLVDTKGNIVIHKVGAADWNTASVHKTLEELLP